MKSVETWSRNETSNNGYVMFEQKPAIWKCDFASGALQFHFTSDHQIPNRFHRFMQKLILGITWTYIGGEKKK